MKFVVSLVLIFTVWGAMAKAVPADSVQIANSLTPSTQAEAAVKDLLEKGLFKQALEQWQTSFGQSAFSKSATGRAFYDFLLFRNDFQVSGIERLFKIPNPQEISEKVRKLWASEVPYDHQVWREVQVPWTMKWRVVFSTPVEDTLLAWHVSTLQNSKDLKNATDLLQRLAVNNPARAWLLWQLGLSAGINNQTGQAVVYFQELLDSNQAVISQEDIYLASARLFYQNGKLEGAAKYYDMVPKGSDHWLEALEEKAWIDVRHGQYEDALSKMKTLMVPFFANQLGPEPYYLSGIANIRTCDYAAVFKMLKTFKERFKDRVGQLQIVAVKGSTPSVIKALGRLEEDGTATGMGDDLNKLPRLYQRDDDLNRWATEGRLAKAETEKLAEILKESPANPELSALKIQALQDAQTARSRSIAKMKTLASRDVAELSRILTRLHVVEVEAIQRMYPNPAVKNIQAAAKKSVRTHSDDEITFPHDDEIWLDELSHYQVSAKGCGG